MAGDVEVADAEREINRVEILEGSRQALQVEDEECARENRKEERADDVSRVRRLTHFQGVHGVDPSYAGFYAGRSSTPSLRLPAR